MRNDVWNRKTVHESVRRELRGPPGTSWSGAGGRAPLLAPLLARPELRSRSTAPHPGLPSPLRRGCFSFQPGKAKPRSPSEPPGVDTHDSSGSSAELPPLPTLPPRCGACGTWWPGAEPCSLPAPFSAVSSPGASGGMRRAPGRGRHRCHPRGAGAGWGRGARAGRGRRGPGGARGERGEGRARRGGGSRGAMQVYYYPGGWTSRGEAAGSAPWGSTLARSTRW